MAERHPNGQIKAKTKEIDGQRHRLCSGRSHEEPTWLPETEKYFYLRKTGRLAGYFKSPCRLCHLWVPGVAPGDHGYIPLKQVQQFFIEGENRIGRFELARRLGIDPANLRKIVEGKRKFVQKMTAKKMMLELVSMRRKGEVRHRDSIRRGAMSRGEPEKVVSGRKDYYRPHGDEDTHAKTRYLKTLAPEKKEEIRTRDRTRRRRGT